MCLHQKGVQNFPEEAILPERRWWHYTKPQQYAMVVSIKYPNSIAIQYRFA